MSIVAWMRCQRDRPIAEHERRTAMAAVVVLLAAITLFFILTQPANQAHGASRNKRQTRPTPATVERRSFALTPEADRVAERFLAGYLGYAYGHTSASLITDASPLLLVSLESHPPRVSPAARARHPRLLSLHAIAAPVGELAIRATVNDGELIDYPLGLVLAAEHGRLLVCGLESA